MLCDPAGLVVAVSWNNVLTFATITNSTHLITEFETFGNVQRTCFSWCKCKAVSMGAVLKQATILYSHYH